MGVFSRMAGWFREVFGLSKSIQDAFGVTIAVSPTMREKQAEWRDIAAGKAQWNNADVPSLHLAGAVSQEIASRVALGLKSEITGSARAAYLNEQYAPVMAGLPGTIATVCNCGEAIYKPYLIDDGIRVSLVETDSYWPVNYSVEKELIDVIFGATNHTDKWVYRLLERHTFDADAQTHAIVYRAFRQQKTSREFMPESLGEPASLADVPGWAGLRDITIQGVEHPLFVVVKTSSSEYIERPQRQGIPVWNKAIDMIQKADEMEAWMAWEFKGSELAVQASSALFRRDVNGRLILPSGKQRLYQTFDGGKEDMPANTFNPEPRIDSAAKRMNDILRRIEFLCGLSYGIISDNNVQEKTAEEFRSSKERLVTTISGFQMDVMQPALERLIASFGVLADLQGVPQGNVETAFEWSESYAIDRKAEVEERVKLLGSGVLFLDEVRAYYNEIPLEEAQAELKARGVPLEHLENEF